MQGSPHLLTNECVSKFQWNSLNNFDVLSPRFRKVCKKFILDVQTDAQREKIIATKDAIINNLTGANDASILDPAPTCSSLIKMLLCCAEILFYITLYHRKSFEVV